MSLLAAGSALLFALALIAYKLIKGKAQRLETELESYRAKREIEKLETEIKKTEIEIREGTITYENDKKALIDMLARLESKRRKRYDH